MIDGYIRLEVLAHEIATTVGTLSKRIILTVILTCYFLVWARPEFWWSPSISHSIDAGLEASGLEKDDIDLYDFYSCFPIVPKLACEHLRIPSVGGAKPITLLGGLTSFGGAGNNYSMHVSGAAPMERDIC